MTLTKSLIPKAKNGVGAFVFSCRKIEFNYCERSGSSYGMIKYLQNHLIPFAKINPQMEIVVTPRPSKHPLITGTYLNLKKKQVCVKNKNPDEIAEIVKLIRDNTGVSTKKRFKKPVISTTKSIRGIWSPFHTRPHLI